MLLMTSNIPAVIFLVENIKYSLGESCTAVVKVQPLKRFMYNVDFFIYDYYI